MQVRGYKDEINLASAESGLEILGLPFPGTAVPGFHITPLRG